VTELGDGFPAVLAAASAGDPQAFAQLWRSSHPILIRYLKVLCGDAAEDIASETWLKAMAALNTFDGNEQGFRGWLIVIARNHARDLSRRAARRPESLSPDLSDHAKVTAPDAADEALERSGTASALRLVATLPGAQAEMVMLRVVVGLDVADVARIVGRSPGAVRVAVHRGLRTLATQLRGPAISPTAVHVTQTAGPALNGRDV